MVSQVRIAILRLWRFALKLPIHVVMCAAPTHNLREIYYWGENHLHIWISGGQLADWPIHHPTSSGVLCN